LTACIFIGIFSVTLIPPSPLASKNTNANHLPFEPNQYRSPLRVPVVILNGYILILYVF
jgi:hypothetical protein